ncbi:uncharacterized protein [Gossypium hirsutum]|uniref:Uncharacterized protein n=1 Tax=Gossypium hirsutum TaxID=3635 RepID=A0A1U8NKI2_GOSHI|nr:uncharacterized protein LOC107949303 [Gossypium hirsutum]
MDSGRQPLRPPPVTYSDAAGHLQRRRRSWWLEKAETFPFVPSTLLNPNLGPKPRKKNKHPKTSRNLSVSNHRSLAVASSTTHGEENQNTRYRGMEAVQACRRGGASDCDTGGCCGAKQMGLGFVWLNLSLSFGPLGLLLLLGLMFYYFWVLGCFVTFWASNFSLGLYGLDLFYFGLVSVFFLFFSLCQNWPITQLRIL